MDDLTRLQQAEAMARRLLWLAFCWNDHNFDEAHIEARREAEKHGIRSFDEANAWLLCESPLRNDAEMKEKRP